MIELSAHRYITSHLKLSGSKSISNRLLILNRIFGSNVLFQNLSDSEDTLLLQKALSQIKGKKKATIDIHNAGTDMRFLTALLSVTEGEWILTGSERIKQRPVAELVAALRELGASISYMEKENSLPLLVRGKKLPGGTVEIDGTISSQFISALLLISPVFEKGLSLTIKGEIVSRPYIDMTISLLKNAGINMEQTGNLISTSPSSLFHLPSTLFVESDWSSASYWYSICALSGNANIELSYLNKKSLQADSVLPELYQSLGVKTTFKEHSILLSSIKPLATELNYDFSNCPDIAQTIAVTCFGLGIQAVLTGLSTLKLKETNRILALKNELEKLGACVEIGSNFIRLDPRNKTQDGSDHGLINTYDDHRMAMSFAPLALVFDKICIDDPNVVNKSYPAFWEDLKSVGFNVNLQA